MIKFDMGKAWRDAVAMISANREVMLVVSGVFFFLPGFAAALLMPDMQPPVGASPEQTEQVLLDFYSRNAPIFVVMALIQTVGLIALIALLRDDRKPTVGEALKIGGVGLLPYIGTQLLIAAGLVLLVAVLVGVPIGLGVGVIGGILGVLCVPLVIYVLVKFSLVTPVIAIEKVMSPIAALQRSWALTKGNSVLLFAFYLLLMVVFFVIAIVIGLVFGVLFALLGTGTAYMIVNGIFSGVLGAAATMIFSAVLAAVHHQLAESVSGISRTFE